MSKDSKKNLGIVGDSKRRIFLLFGCIIGAIAIGICVIKYQHQTETKISDDATLKGAPQIASVPGVGQSTSQYVDLQNHQNVDQAMSAVQTGKSAVPTIIRPSLKGDLSGQDNGTDCSVAALKRARYAGVKAQELRCKGCDAKALLAAGYTAAELHQAGVTAAELLKAGLSPAQLRQAGFSASELKSAGVSASDLRSAGYDASQLLKAGYNPKELAKAGYSAHQLQQAGISAKDLKKIGYPSSQLAGLTEKKNCQKDHLSSLKQKGTSVSQIKAMGCSVAEMLAAGYTPSQLREAGYSASELKAAGVSPEDLRKAGYTAAQLLKAGFAPADLVQAGYSANDLKNSGLTAHQLKEAGMLAQDLKKAGYSDQALADAGYTPGELIRAGVPANKICSEAQAKKAYQAGVSASVLKSQGCSAETLKRAGYSASDLKVAGYTPSELKSAGYTADQLKAVGFSPSDLKQAGFSAQDLKNAGFTAKDLKTAGFSPSELKSAGYTADQLKAVGFSPSDLKQAGFGAQDLKNAGFTAKDLKTAGFSPSELKSAGFSDSDLKKAGFSQAQIDRAGSDSDSSHIGCSPSDLKFAYQQGFTAEELHSQGCSTKALAKAGFAVDGLDSENGQPKITCQLGDIKKGLSDGVSAKAFIKKGCDASLLKQAGYTVQELKRAGAKDIPEDSGSDLISSGLEQQIKDANDPNKNQDATAKMLKNLQEQQNRLMNEQERKLALSKLTQGMSSQAMTIMNGWSGNSVQQAMKVAPAIIDNSGKTSASGGNAVDQFTGQTIKAGTILFAVLDTGINSDQSSPILATIVSGKLKGSRLLGSFKREDTSVLLNFNLVNLPNYDKSVSINVVAVDQKKSRTLLASHVDNHYLLRYGTLFASSFVKGVSEGIKSSGTTITKSADETIISNPSRSTLQQGLIGLGEVGTSIGGTLSDYYSTPPTVWVYPGTGIGILFMSDFKLPS
jgi:intracellular multiplication protein IcmE